MSILKEAFPDHQSKVKQYQSLLDHPVLILYSDNFLELLYVWPLNIDSTELVTPLDSPG